MSRSRAHTSGVEGKPSGFRLPTWSAVNTPIRRQTEETSTFLTMGTRPTSTGDEVSHMRRAVMDISDDDNDNAEKELELEEHELPKLKPVLTQKRRRVEDTTDEDAQRIPENPQQNPFIASLQRWASASPAMGPPVVPKVGSDQQEFLVRVRIYSVFRATKSHADIVPRFL